VKIKDRDGSLLVEVESLRDLDAFPDLRRADFSGQDLEGITIIQADLREADFTGADMYWASGFESNFDGAILRNTQLAGADLKCATFRGADLRGAYISFDNLNGSPSLEGADLTGSLLDGADLKGCEYNDSTRFPEGFDPAARGMIWVDPRRIFVRPGSFASARLNPGYYVPDPDNPGSYLPVPDKNK